MACFIVPAGEAVVTTIAAHLVKKNETEETVRVSLADGHIEEMKKISLSTKLGWLNKLLWGGSALLAFEHVWHGEVVPFFPFLTAVKTGETMGMLSEMSTTGVLMTVLVTAVWGIMVAVAGIAEKKAVSDAKLLER